MALEFGADDHITITDDGTYDLNNPITVEFLIKSDGIVDDGAGYIRVALALNDGATTTSLLFLPLAWNVGLDAYLIAIIDHFGAANAAWTFTNDRTNHPLWDGEWHHLAFVTNDTPANCLLYIDSVSEGAPDVTVGTLPDPTSTDTVFIGSTAGPANFLGAGNTRHLDEVRIWNDARTAKEIRTNRHRRIWAGEGLVGCFRLDEPSGTTAYDLLKGPNGTLTNFPASPWEPSGAIVYPGRSMTVVY